MRCALLVLVALLKAQALRTEHADADLQRSQMPAGEEALRRIFGVEPAADVSSSDERNDYGEMSSEYPDDQFKSIDQLDDAQLQRVASYLLKGLQRPNIYEAPVLFAKDPINRPDDQPHPLQLDELKSVAKRTRYYRRYPWKRQNSRNYQSLDYDPYNTCTLTRKDVFKLLVALHDARQGNKSRIVNFCNRKRPASAVYTNIRFLGRRRK